MMAAFLQVSWPRAPGAWHQSIAGGADSTGLEASKPPVKARDVEQGIGQLAGSVQRQRGSLRPAPRARASLAHSK